MSLFIHEPGRGYYTPLSPLHFERRVNELEHVAAAEKSASVLKNSILLPTAYATNYGQGVRNTLNAIGEENTSHDAKISEVMSQRLITLEGSAPIEAAWELYEAHSIHHIVVSEQSKVTGILSFGDILSFIFNSKLDLTSLKDIPVREFIPRFMYSAGPSVQISVAARLLLNQNLNAIAVIDQNLMVGVLTSSDLLKTIAANHSLHVEA
ncbi:MAG: CBS domain-containing protein [Hahellaceae bacterium]|nr:CBS domain-containing protein [Hahellaceae bacterium]